MDERITREGIIEEALVFAEKRKDKKKILVKQYCSKGVFGFDLRPPVEYTILNYLGDDKETREYGILRRAIEHNIERKQLYILPTTKESSDWVKECKRMIDCGVDGLHYSGFGNLEIILQICTQEMIDQNRSPCNCGEIRNIYAPLGVYVPLEIAEKIISDLC